MPDTIPSIELPGPLQLAALRRYDILNTPPETTYDRILDLACDVLGAEMGLLSFFDVNREWFKARRRFPWTEVPLNKSFGRHAVKTDGVTVIEDAREHPLFAASPFVTAPPRIRFYAAAPLKTPDGHRIGCLAVMEPAPYSPSPAEVEHLSTLAELVIDTLERRRLTPKNSTSDAPVHMAVLARDGTILQVNDAWISFAQANSIDDLSTVQPGQNYLDAWTTGEAGPEARKAREGIRSVIEGRRDHFDMTYPCHAPNTKRWFRMEVSSFSPPDHPAQAVVSHTDVTPEEKQVLDARLLETAVEESNDVVLITEASPLSYPGPRITYVNPAFTRVTGYEPEEVIGRTPRFLQGPDTEPWVLERMREALSRGESFEGEAINYRKDGTPYINRWSIAPVRDEDDTITHWVSVQQDVTKDRRVRRELLQAQEEERRRIAQKMHDEMGGLLASMQMAVDAAQALDVAPREESTPLDDLKTLSTDLSKVVRTLTEELHSRVLDDYGLSGALTRLVASVDAEPTGSVVLRSTLSHAERLPPIVEKVAYRGAQQALNAVTEAPGTIHARVVVHTNDQTLFVRVIGRSELDRVDTPAEWSEEAVLNELKHRVERLNGCLDVEVRDGRVMRVTLTLPVTFLPPSLES